MLQAAAIYHGYSAAGYRYYLAGHEPTQNLACRGARSPGDARQRFLGHRDRNALIVSCIKVAQIQEPAHHASFGGYVQRLEPIGINLLEPGGKEFHEEPVYAGIRRPETLELVPAKSQRLRCFQRDYRASAAMGIADQGELAECVTRPEDHDGDELAAGQCFAHADMARRNQ